MKKWIKKNKFVLAFFGAIFLSFLGAFLVRIFGQPDLLYFIGWV